ncbi:hypothetical protein ABEB36_000331 [Hypothenemus hampei]|uniref:Uncharacterized protein n=1 Tax=Hypothenemus hampei TaxID=57062 RepID=A0ABD1FCT8_HYPHA
MDEYGANCLPKKPQWNHTKTKALKCIELKMADTMKIYKDFYSKKNKIYQDTYILKWCKSTIPKRHRNVTVIKKSISIEYSVPALDDIHKKICREAFCDILEIKGDRIQGLMKRYQSGKILMEGRGVDRVKGKNYEKKNSVSKLLRASKA